MTSGVYSMEELAAIGFRSIGSDVRISRRASLYSPEKISLGNHVRIDDYCVISAGDGGVTFGSYIHLGVYTSIIGGGEVTLDDFANISSRVSIFSSNDDYSGLVMTGPMVPSEFTGIIRARVRIGRHVIAGCGSVILPGVTVGDGAAIGALSFVVRDCEPFGIYCGVPARRTGRRQERLLDLEAQFQIQRLADAGGSGCVRA